MTLLVILPPCTSGAWSRCTLLRADVRDPVSKLDREPCYVQDHLLSVFGIKWRVSASLAPVIRFNLLGGWPQNRPAHGNVSAVSLRDLSRPYHGIPLDRFGEGFRLPQEGCEAAHKTNILALRIGSQATHRQAFDHALPAATVDRLNRRLRHRVTTVASWGVLRTGRATGVSRNQSTSTMHAIDTRPSIPNVSAHAIT